MPATFGRGDVNQLYKNFAAGLQADRKERQQREMSGHGNAPSTDLPTSVVMVTYPYAKNAIGIVMMYEAESVAPCLGAEKLVVRAKNERGLIREARWAYAEHLRSVHKVDAAEARKRAVNWPVFIADRLPAKPSSTGLILGADGAPMSEGP